MKKKLIKNTVTVLTMAAIIGSQSLSVCAAQDTAMPTVAKENLIKYYEENFDVED